jgi:purine-binding chemotaxis protein CheW
MGEGAAPADHGQVRRILEQRARALARPLATEEPDGALDLVVVVLGPERYGIDIRSVREVQPLHGLTSVPGVPAWWAGVVNIRGTLYPVLDPRPRLSLPAQAEAEAEERKVVLVRNGGVYVGLLVDDAPGVSRVPAREIRPPLAGTVDADRPMVRGVTPDLLTILDVGAMLNDPSLAVQQQPSEEGVGR